MQEIDDIQIDNPTEQNYINYNFQYLEAIELTYIHFFHNFMLTNLPCVIKNVSLDWQCTKKLTLNNQIHYEYIKNNYGHFEAPVADCNNLDYNAHSKTNMSVKDYMDYMKESHKNNLLYLKDWHLKRLQPENAFYDVPLLFSSDWLNEFAVDHNEDDFMFVYIGPKKSWTPLHVDVYHSYSWSVNVVGQKKWILFPPGHENKLKDKLGNLPQLFSPDKYPDIKYIEIIQEKGDAIFVPSGWHHQVLNLVDTISVNHNWVNACNIELVWNALNVSLANVEHEIGEFSESPDFSSQCQLILKSLFGMNFSDFINFVCYIGQKRINQINSDTRLSFGGFQLGKNHILFDLKKIRNIINKICCHPLFIHINSTPSIQYDVADILNNISMILNK